jgi:histidinol phosphatase-like PHP family hydrolase
MISDYRVIDMHVHSHLSGCADSEPEYATIKILEHAAALGVDGIGFADHIFDPDCEVPDEVRAEYAERPGFERTVALREELEGLELPASLSVAVGAEIDVWAPGVFALAPGNRKLLDFAGLSANHPPLMLEYEPPSNEPGAIAEFLLAKARFAVESGAASVLGHPLLAMGFDRPAEVYSALQELELESLFESARDATVAIGFSRHLLADGQLARSDDVQSLYSRAARVGAHLAFETDSHSLEQLSCIVALVQLAQDIDLTPENFLAELPDRVAESR